jgi:hypothetical protein
MRSLLFVAAALTLTSDDATLDGARDLELTFRIDGDSLVTWNPTYEPELVILQDPLTGATTSFFVPARSRAQLEIPCDLSRSVRVLASVRTEEGLFYSDAWAINDLAVLGTVWIEVDQGVAFSWILTDAGYVTVGPTSPPLLSSMLVTTTTTHVPMITPYDSTSADTPPPLPPLPPSPL